MSAFVLDNGGTEPSAHIAGLTGDESKKLENKTARFRALEEPESSYSRKCLALSPDGKNELRTWS